MPARPRGGLGRGLDALIPESQAPADSSIPVDSITDNPYQPRTGMDAAELESLTASVREHGVLQPVLVQPAGLGYQLIAGHRRLEAARRAGLERVPAIIREESAEDNLLLLALVENLQRADLSPLDEAGAYRELNRRFGLSVDQIAGRTGRSRPAVSNVLRLLELAPEVKALLQAGKLSEGHARALLGLREHARQTAAAQTVLARALNVRQTEALVKQLLSQRPERRRARDRSLEHLEQRFRDALRTKVTVSGSERSGKITIHYYSEEELHALYEQLVSEE